jgi:hypothetical protein
METTAVLNPTPTRLETGMHQGNLLNGGVRRDIADLNRLFLDRALDSGVDWDPWFRLPSTAAARLREASADARERAVQCPFTLFEFSLPDPADGATRPVDAVADVAAPGRNDATWAESHRAFGITALAVVRRLTIDIPMAPRIAFGLPAGTEARLHALSLSESYRVAAWPGLIRPRWPAHERYWGVLAELVTNADAVHWAYAAGLCLLGQCGWQSPAAGCGARRPVRRPTHRRQRSGGPDVPC